MLCIVERLWPLLAFINRVFGRNVLGHGLTMSWLFVALQPSIWSKRPGTWINDVLAFCRVKRKYVGCIELLFKVYRAICRFSTDSPFSVLSHCDLDLLRTDLKIHRVNARGTAYIPAKFRRHSLKNNGKSSDDI